MRPHHHPPISDCYEFRFLSWMLDECLTMFVSVLMRLGLTVSYGAVSKIKAASLRFLEGLDSV